MIVAKNLLAGAIGEQRSERAATAECTADVVDVAARHTQMRVSALIRIRSLRQQRECADESDREN